MIRQAWANKAEALASYARQAKDETLRKMAERIQARAIRRCGELLKQIPAQQGANQNIQEGTLPNVLTRTEAATQAGLSEHQRKTALRVAQVPTPEFEAAVESESPPTVTALAEKGTQKKPDVSPLPDNQPLFQLNGIDPAHFARAIRAAWVQAAEIQTPPACGSPRLSAPS